MTHIIWDFNGTLLCDAQLSVDTDNAVFDMLGLPRITLETYRERMTMPVRDFYLALGIDYDVHPYETIARLWLDRFNASAVGAGLVPGALEIIRRLGEMSVDSQLRFHFRNIILLADEALMAHHYGILLAVHRDGNGVLPGQRGDL